VDRTSMVQKGKLLASAARLCVSALKSVDLPTLGTPTMPAASPRFGAASPGRGRRTRTQAAAVGRAARRHSVDILTKETEEVNTFVYE